MKKSKNNTALYTENEISSSCVRELYAWVQEQINQKRFIDQNHAIAYALFTLRFYGNPAVKATTKKMEIKITVDAFAIENIIRGTHHSDKRAIRHLIKRELTSVAKQKVEDTLINMKATGENLARFLLEKKL